MSSSLALRQAQDKLKSILYQEFSTALELKKGL